MSYKNTKIVHLSDYSSPAYWIDTVELTIDLDPDKTEVRNFMTLRRNHAVNNQPLALNGEELTLISVAVDKSAVAYKQEDNLLLIDNLPDKFTLEIVTTCAPAANSTLMGLYVSNQSFFTQCESEGFRRITYFMDRPDVMASYSVTLCADQEKYPLLLSNGNLVAEGALANGRHFARWVDPHRKPCYLFALVAGRFVVRERQIKTESGQEHLLQVYVRPGDLDKTEHAMNSLIESIKWDQKRFGLPLDLERFMIVATSDFNMGAMENKGLNIFNTKYVLANQETATDIDYFNVERVVGHEYFHNWTGNRVTCRDWFQLSLKEGLTVFRDQEFSQDLAVEASARAVRRIENVRLLRTAQFSEDAGPMAHPVRPESYMEINNFYTMTIYEKGAEVVRMMQTLVGRDGFAKGITLYFERHDGQAVTCDDFAQAIADANPDSPLAKLLSQFKRWYSQAGTPRIKASGLYNESSNSYTLTLSQNCPATVGQTDKEPFVIPVTIGLVSADPASDNHDLALNRAGETTETIVLSDKSQSITFSNIKNKPVPSILRGFSAPVLLDFDYSDGELLTLLNYDSDPFNRWEAGQRLGLRRALSLIADPNVGKEVIRLDAAYLQAMRGILRHPTLDPAFKEIVLTLPSQAYISEQLEIVDPELIHKVREAMLQSVAESLFDDWQWAYQSYHQNGEYRFEPNAAGRRALSGMALAMLCRATETNCDKSWPEKTLQQFNNADNMTDRFNALVALVVSDCALAAEALEKFYNRFKDDELVMDKWFALQASAPDRDGNMLEKVRRLAKHPAFNLRNPNRTRSLIFSYCVSNPGGFHRVDGAGYQLWADYVLKLDPANPQVAARLARAMDRWKKLSEPYRSTAYNVIANRVANQKLSGDVREVIERALAE